eukprot:s3584_g4.t1
MSGSKRDATMAHLPWPASSRPDASGSTSTPSAPNLVLPSSSSSTTTATGPATTPLDPMVTSQTYGATPPSASGGPIPSPFVSDTTDGAPYHTFNQYSQERRLPKHQLMFTVVEWNHGTPAASRDLMVTETNLETGRPREHQVEFFFFKLVGDWNMAQRMGNYWRQHYGLDTFHNMSKSSGDSNFIQIQIPPDCYEGVEENQKKDFFLLHLGDAFVVEVDETVFQMDILPEEENHETEALLAREAEGGRGNVEVGASLTEEALNTSGPGVSAERQPSRSPSMASRPSRLSSRSSRSHQSVHVQVPEGVKPGEKFFVVVDDMEYEVWAPEGSSPGEMVAMDVYKDPVESQKALTASRESGKSRRKGTNTSEPESVATDGSLVYVQVPDGCIPGETFFTDVNGFEYEILVPSTCQSGDLIYLEVPAKRTMGKFVVPENSPAALPYDAPSIFTALSDPSDTSRSDHLADIRVPTGVYAGQTFVVIIDGVEFEATILHAAAFSEFREHVRRLAAAGDPVSAYFLLAAAGDPVSAYFLWVNAVEVLHSPFQANFETEIQGLPQLCRAPCTLSNCVRCSQQLGGFKFPWLGTWNSRGVVVPPGVQPDEAWRRYYESQEPMDLIMVNMYCGVTTAKDVVPQYLYELQLRISSGQTGQLGMGEFFAAWRDWLLCFEDRSFPAHFWDPRLIPRSPRGRPWPALGTVGCQFHRSLCGWLDSQKVRHYEMGTGCLARIVESEGRCGWGPRAFPQQLLQHDCPDLVSAPGSQHLLALRTLATVLGCFAMTSSGKGIYAAQAASSSSGGDPDPGWSAADSLQQIAASRARQWRESEGLTLDNDFAFAFVDYDHVVGAAGHHVADEWLRVRSKVEEDLLHQGAQAVEGPKQPMPFKPVRKQILKKKPQSRPQAPAKATEADQRRVTGLVSLFQGMGSFKPAGILTEALKSEWKQTCTRIAQKKVKDAEKATLDRVVNTWLELRSFLEGRGRPAPPGVVDLDQFLQHTSAPARALQALKWINKHADQEFDLANLQVPATPRVTGPKGQAPVAEPPLIQALENRIEELYSVGDERWSVLLGCWMMCFGCLRYTHITRSEPRKLTAAFLHCRCLKGKQQKNRDGFDFAIPAHFLSGWYWAKAVVDAFRSLAPSRQRAAGLCFSDEGRPWTIKEVQDSMQVEMGVLVDNPEDITTYSWRRVGPTTGMPA